MAEPKDYYSILGVLPTAELVVMRAAYRALSMKYHPDKWTGEKATGERRMRELNEAYEVLSDERLRQEYDSKRRNGGFEEDDFDTTTQDAFSDAEQAQRSDWEVATEYYPDLNALGARLRKTSSKLAFAFRTMILETKQFTNRVQLADKLEAKFLHTYFGHNKEILAFARSLIDGGRKTAAKELNWVVSVLGEGADVQDVIYRIKGKFFEQTPSQLTVQAAKRLKETQYVSDAIGLIKMLGGVVRPERTGWISSELVVRVRGERHGFETDYDMAQWVLKFVVPKVLSGTWQ